MTPSISRFFHSKREETVPADTDIDPIPNNPYEVPVPTDPYEVTQGLSDLVIEVETLPDDPILIWPPIVITGFGPPPAVPPGTTLIWPPIVIEVCPPMMARPMMEAVVTKVTEAVEAEVLTKTV
jgi:hypothetical protein